MKTIKTTLKLSVILALLLCLSFCFLPKINSYADSSENYSLSTFVNRMSGGEQDITSTLPFNANFEGETVEARENGWQTAGELTTGNQTTTALMTREDEITTGSGEDENKSGVKYNEIKSASGDYSMLLLNLKSGVSAIETKENILIPSRAIFLLSIDVKVQSASNKKGVYINLIEGKEQNPLRYNISNIYLTQGRDGDVESATIYQTYAFIIEGNELYDTNAKLQISMGTRTENSDGTSSTTAEVGIAAIDNIKLIAISSSQYETLKKDSKVKIASFSNIQKDSTAKIANGAFNFTSSQKYTDYNGEKLFAPENWTHSTTTNNTEVDFGIVNTNETMFNKNLYSTSLVVKNPGLTTYQTTGDITNKYNNVLMLVNKSRTNQKLSTGFTLSKDNIYEITFEFCTPAIFENISEENNSLSFYVKNGNEIIYKRENVYSYQENEHQINLTKWVRYSLIVETAEEKNLTFEIVFGDESNAKEGIAYVDNVLAVTRSKEKAFDNIYANTIQLNESEEYLKTGYVSLENVKNAKDNNIISTYKFEKTTEGSTNTNENNSSSEESTNTGINTSTLWFVIPSALLAICTIAGLVIFYGLKIKNSKIFKKRARNKTGKVSYRRNSSTNNSQSKAKVEQAQAEKEQTIETQQTEVLSTEEQIEKLDKEFSENKISKKAYLKKRAKLERKLD